MNQPLAEAIFWIAALACAVAEVAILRSSFAAKNGNRSELVPAASRGGELVWAILPAIALSALLLVTWRRVEARETHSQMDHSRVDPAAMTQPAHSAHPPAVRR